MFVSDESVEKEALRQFEILKFGTAEITPENEFMNMLRHSIKTKTPLRVKCGIDPTGRDVHLGHLVPYRKMRQFQDLGHVGVVIIGDYTAQIGDPTGKNESRKSLTLSETRENAERYMEQLYTVLDRSKTEIRFQTEWFAKTDLKEIIGWASEVTVAKLLSHDTFSNRLSDGHSLSLHELFYPVLQGMDSVFINADIELGGQDQRFNVLMGRDFQKNRGKRSQVAMLLPIVTGTCGTQKMSKSLNNYIGIKDEPFDKFGKVMSIPDTLMKEYTKYILGVSQEEFLSFSKQLDSGELHPNEAKKELARKIVAFFHGEDIGIKMREQFEAVFKNKGIPDDIEEYHYTRGTDIISLMADSKAAPSKSEARRLLQQGGVSIVDGDKISALDFKFTGEEFVGKVLKIGKRKFLKLV